MNTTTAEQLRTIAATIRNNPTAREAISEGFDLIAAAMEPCIDCQREPATLDPADMPDAGMDNATAAAQA